MGAQWKQKWRELAADKKGKVVGKLVREIQVAARLGGANPEYNARLAAALENARKQSVTRDTIDRAIAKGSGTGADAVQYQTLVYEGFSPHRVPVIVECLTDNTNRTSSEIRVLFRAGSMGTPGSVAWMFTPRGLIEATHPQAGLDVEEAAIEAGADEVELIEEEAEEGTHARFMTIPTELDLVTKALRAAGWVVSQSEPGFVAKETPELTEAQQEEVTQFLQALDEHPDVHRIYTALK